jgi:hypothetical protein
MFPSAFISRLRWTPCLGLVLFLMYIDHSGLTGGYAQSVKVYVSSQAGDRLTPKPIIEFSPIKKEEVTFRINDSMRL